MTDREQTAYELGKHEAVRNGRWVKIYENGEPAIEQHQVGVFCSRCAKMPKDRFTESDFCPNCGAKMDLEEIG